MLDLPPHGPPQYVPAVIAQAPQAPKADSSSIRAIGVCHLIQNPPIPPGTAVNTLSPLRAAKHYLNVFEQRFPELRGNVSVLKQPQHGELEGNERGIYGYFPSVPEYNGPDHAEFLVEIDGLNVKVVYYFKVGPSAWGGTEGYDPHKDKTNCPNGDYWKISLFTK